MTEEKTADIGELVKRLERRSEIMEALSDLSRGDSRSDTAALEMKLALRDGSRDSIEAALALTTLEARCAELEKELIKSRNFWSERHAKLNDENRTLRDRIEREPVVKPFYVIDIPINAEGKGPCTVEEATSIIYEVWDHSTLAHGSYDLLSDAIRHADRLNFASAPERLEAEPEGFLDRETGSLRHIVQASDLSRYVPLYASLPAVVTDEMVEAATGELLEHGEFSSFPENNRTKATIAARAALEAALASREAT